VPLHARSLSPSFKHRQLIVQVQSRNLLNYRAAGSSRIVTLLQRLIAMMTQAVQQLQPPPRIGDHCRHALARMLEHGTVLSEEVAVSLSVHT